MPDKNVVARVIDWLNMGYPQDVPLGDRAAVMAVLRHNLNDAQLEEVVLRLMKSREARGEEYVSDNRINEYIRKVVDQVPTPEDISRVAQILGANGLKISSHHLTGEDPSEGSEYIVVEDAQTTGADATERTAGVEEK